MKSIKTLLLALMGLASSQNPAFGQAGSLDSSFHEDGVTFVNFPGGNASAAAIAVLPNEKILVAGTVADGPGNDANILLLRFNPDGSLDPSFGNGGSVQYSWGEQHDFAQAMTVQQDGRILVAGNTISGDKSYPLLLRFTEEGVLDNSFDEDGIIYKGVELTDNLSTDIFTTSSGQIIWCLNTKAHDSSINRYFSDGAIDTIYGKQGEAYFPLPGGQCRYSTWALLPDDRMVALPWFDIVGFDGDHSLKFWFLRYDANGDYDGVNRTISADELAYNDAIVDESSIVTLGNSINRFDYSGNYIEDFIGNLQRIRVEDTIATGLALAKQVDNKFIAVGYGREQAFVRRYESNGLLDEQFGNEGEVLLNFSPRNDIAYATAIDADDRILVAGQSGDSLFIARLHGHRATGPPNPGVDSTFFHFRPNPVGNAFTADYGLPTDASFSLELMDVLGRQVHRFYAQAPRQAGHYVEPIEVPAELPNGTYYIRFRSSDAGFLRKIIIIR